ncbi:MAG: hypothetical protein RL328_1928 [Acidobacteriota bacterium]|jgi:quercetin dioxygenase-like cupin family protein
MSLNLITRAIPAVAALFLSATLPTEAANENSNFDRVTVAIGTVANKLQISGDGNLQRTNPAAAESMVFEVSKQLDRNPQKEFHTYLANFETNGHSDWHSHPGLELDTHTGIGPELVFYILNRDGSCRRQVLAPGQALVVLPGETHLARNESGQKASIIVQRIHPGDSPTLPVTNHQSQPTQTATCPAI